MFGFIKKLFGGIFAFLGGLIGGKKANEGDTSSNPAIAPQGKKSKGYYLELDETGNTISEVKSKLEAVKTEVLNSEPVQAVATVASKKLEAAAPKKAEKPEPAKASTESAPQNGKVKIEAQANPPATNGKASEKVTFAPNYLLPTTSNSRRRPGPSMNMFRDMARQVKTPG